MEKVEVVVVGAGITGLSAAWRLAASGHEVVVLERFALGHDRGSSHGATRIFRFAYDDPTYVRMAQAALPLWRELEAMSGEEILRITGGFDAGPAALLSAIEAALHSCGAAGDILDPTETKKRFPWIDLGDASTLFSPDTGVLAAARALEALAAAALSGGAELRENRPIRSLAPDDAGVTIVTDAGELRASRVVMAAGAWAAPLLDPIGIRLPVNVTREQVFYFRGPADVVPFIHHGEISRYSVPVYAGAAGIKVAEHTTGEETSAEGRSFEMDPEGAARVASYVEQTLPSFDPEPVAFETCLYTITPDEGFVLDRVGPVVVASPCSGHGFKFGPIVGEAIARLATNQEPFVPLAAFALNRF